MKVTYELSIGEIKALIELISELCKRAGIEETLSRSIFRKLNERHFKIKD